MGAPWKDEEIEIIRKYHKLESDSEMMLRLPGRGRIAIERMRIKMRLIKTNSNNVLVTIMENQRQLRNRTVGG